MIHRNPLSAFAFAVCFAALCTTGAIGLEVRFLAESKLENVKEVVMVAKEKVGEPFVVPTKFLSEAQEPPGRQFQLRTVAGDRKLATVTLPKAGKSFVILLVKKREDSFRSLVVRTDDPSFRPGDNYIHNSSKNPIVGYVGSSKFRLPPGKGRVIRPSGPTPKGFHEVGFGVVEKDGPRPLSMTRWPVDEKIRSYVFFYQNARTGRVDYRAVDEFVRVSDPEK